MCFTLIVILSKYVYMAVHVYNNDVSIEIKIVSCVLFIYIYVQTCLYNDYSLYIYLFQN